MPVPASPRTETPEDLSAAGKPAPAKGHYPAVARLPTVTLDMEGVEDGAELGELGGEQIREISLTALGPAEEPLSREGAPAGETAELALAALSAPLEDTTREFEGQSARRTRTDL